jgi:basic amino acid/polyamine antiporter, APA family
MSARASGGPQPGAVNRAFTRFGYKKNIDRLLHEASHKEGLAKTLTAKDLIVLGVAGIIGAGIFVLIGEGIRVAGVGVIPAFVVAALICAVAGYAYAELASSIPASGSAYAYIYTAMGELPGWLVAWALVLEYAVGAIAVAVGWRNNLLALINQFKDSDPTTDMFSNADRPWLYWFTHSPFESVETAGGEVLRGIINVPSVLIVLIITLFLIRGTKESARFTFVLVVIKTLILILAIVGGFLAFEAVNFDDSFPHDLADDPNTDVAGDAVDVDEDGDVAPGDQAAFFDVVRLVFAGAAIMFFAYIGFDSVSTTAEETKNPKKDMPKGILGSLAITTVLYVLAATALTGAAHWTTFVGNSVAATNARGEPFGYVFEQNGFLEVGEFALGALLIRVGAIVGTTSVLLVLILGGVRVFFNMSRDGLLPPVLNRVSKRGTPAIGTLIYGGFTMVFAALLTLGDAVNLVNIGTLFAFFMVIVAVWVFRVRRPDVERPFRMPLWTIAKTRKGAPVLPVLAILGMLGTLALIASLDSFTLKASLGWMGLGLLLYAFYSIRHSKEAGERHGGPGVTPFPSSTPALTTGVGEEFDLAPPPSGRKKGKGPGGASGGGGGGSSGGGATAKSGKSSAAALAPGDVALIDVEGIGPKWGAKLEAQGIHTAYELRDADKAALAAATSIPAREIEKWQGMAELLVIDGIGPQYAEALVRSGVASLETLAGRSAQELHDCVDAYRANLGSKVIGQPTSPSRTAKWIKEARAILAQRSGAPGVAA